MNPLEKCTKVKHASSNFQMNRGIRVAQFSREMFSYKNFLKRFVLQKIFSTDVFLQFKMFHSLSAVQLNHLETIPFVPFSLKSSSFTGSSCFRYFWTMWLHLTCLAFLPLLTKPRIGNFAQNRIEEKCDILRADVCTDGKYTIYKYTNIQIYKYTNIQNTKYKRQNTKYKICLQRRRVRGRWHLRTRSNTHTT